MNARQQMLSSLVAMSFKLSILQMTDYGCQWKWKHSQVETTTVAFKIYLICHKVEWTEDPKIKIDTSVVYHVYNKYVKNNNSKLQSQTGCLMH